MICDSCKKEFENIDELKFCPFCGEKIEEVDLGAKEISDEIQDQEEGKIEEPPLTTKIKQDTLKMPAITEADVKKYNRNKFISDMKGRFIQKKVLVPLATLFVIIVVGVFGYKLLIAKPADQVTINEDLVGKVLTLPMGTKIEIKKDYIKSFSVKSRNTNKDKGKDEVKVAVTINNGIVEVKTLLDMLYVNKGENKWEFNGNIAIDGVAEVKPVIVMDEKQFLQDLKKLTISIDDQSIQLSGDLVKSITVNEKTPDLKNSKEEVSVTLGVDTGILAASGKIKCKLNFENEKWKIDTIARNSTEDFVSELSPTISQDKIVGIIKKDGLDEMVTHKDLFAGKEFNVNDVFTKSISISDKQFDGTSKTLTAKASRVYEAGEIKSTLVTNYSFSLSFSDITLVKRSKTIVFTSNVNEISNDKIIATITSDEIEGGNAFLWFADKHKISAEEAKTFKTTEILSKKGLNNIKYVYGNLTYMDKNKDKNVSVVAEYSLDYDNSKGFTWKLEKLISEDSSKYKNYSKEAIIKQG